MEWHNRRILIEIADDPRRVGTTVKGGKLCVKQRKYFDNGELPDSYLLIYFSKLITFTCIINLFFYVWEIQVLRFSSFLLSLA